MTHDAINKAAEAVFQHIPQSHNYLVIALPTDVTKKVDPEAPCLICGTIPREHTLAFFWEFLEKNTEDPTLWARSQKSNDGQ